MTSAEPPVCPRCRGEALLWARVPYGWTNREGGRVEGRSGVVLCPACDARAPGAAALITWFHVHGRADDEDEEFVRLLVRWATGVSVPPLDEHAPEAENERWQRGDL
nr:DUF6300 family protein [Nonomuraea longispora]